MHGNPGSSYGEYCHGNIPSHIGTYSYIQYINIRICDVRTLSWQENSPAVVKVRLDAVTCRYDK